MSNKGWECPKCGNCYSPTTSRCLQCGPKVAETAPTPFVNPQPGGPMPQIPMPTPQPWGSPWKPSWDPNKITSGLQPLTGGIPGVSTPTIAGSFGPVSSSFYAGSLDDPNLHYTNN